MTPAPAGSLAGHSGPASRFEWTPNHQRAADLNKRRARFARLNLLFEEVPLALFGRTDGAAPAEPAHDETPAPKSAGPTVIGPGARIVGDLSGDENVLVQGRVEGSIRGSGEITVSPGGEVEGEIRARAVVVGGRVLGEIVAEEKAELLASAFVRGKVQAPRIVIAEGAQLEGNVAMSAERGASSALEETEG